jgi:hypothetical protein
MVNYGALNGPSMIVVSDDNESLKIFKNFYPQAKIPSNNSIQLESSKGNHNLKKEELKVSKDEMNVEMLSDFFILASCSVTTWGEPCDLHSLTFTPCPPTGGITNPLKR